VSNAAIGRRYGSAFGTVYRATKCATRYSAKKNAAYESEPDETWDWRAM